MPSFNCVRKLRPRYRPFPNTCGAQSNSIDRGLYTISFSKILQARLQQYVNQEIPDVQAGFRKGICWIIEKAKEFQKNIYFCFIDYAKAFDYVNHSKL